MNSVPGQIAEEVADDAEADARRGIKLLYFASPKKRSRLRIDVDDSLLLGKRSPDRKRRPSQKRDFPGNDPFGVTGPAIILALAGLAIGFLIGRQRKSQ